MSPIPSTHLRNITSFPTLVEYLSSELDWPIDAADFDSYAFEWDAVEDLGVAPEYAARIRDIKQLRPLTANQPWGVLFIEFEPKKLPDGVLRRLTPADNTLNYPEPQSELRRAAKGEPHHE